MILFDCMARQQFDVVFFSRNLCFVECISMWSRFTVHRRKCFYLAFDSCAGIGSLYSIPSINALTSYHFQFARNVKVLKYTQQFISHVLKTLPIIRRKNGIISEFSVKLSITPISRNKQRKKFESFLLLIDSLCIKGINIVFALPNSTFSISFSTCSTFTQIITQPSPHKNKLTRRRMMKNWLEFLKINSSTLILMKI